MRIDGAVEQVKRAYEISGGKGAININVLWEMGGAQPCWRRAGAHQRLVTGVTCGAGMPYKLSEIAAHEVQRLLLAHHQLGARLSRAVEAGLFTRCPEWLAAVVYEDPWLAGGHNGLSNAEDPLKAGRSLSRASRPCAIRCARKGISDDVPIVMAGGVWYLRDWNDWIDNPGAGHDCLPVRHAAAADARKARSRRDGKTG
jgi:NAD(P)H-dependent flavin oxidoreductase YrpB (nitropropane dioxygenase family)